MRAGTGHFRGIDLDVVAPAVCDDHRLERVEYYGHPTELLWCVFCDEMQETEAPPCTWDLCWCRRPDIWEEHGSIMRLKGMNVG